MSQSIVLDMKGEHTYASDLSGVPQGSLALGLNININRLGIAEPRPGFDVLSHSLPLVADRANKLVFWNTGLFAHYSGTTFAYYDSSTGFSSRGSLSAPSRATSCRFVRSQNKNLYATGSTGLLKTDAVGTSLSAAGVPKGLTIDLAVAGAGSAVANNNYVTYRYLIARKDANSNIAYGGVSGRFTLLNSSGSTQDVTAKCYIPTGLDTTYFLQLYRSPGSTASSTTDELQLCYEQPLSSTDVTNGYVTITDLYPDALLGATIYTAASQQGLVNDNARPPLARDVAEFKTCLFYADIDQPQRLQFSLISASGSGFVSGDTIAISNGTTTETYTGAASESSGSKQFQVTTTGSSSQNIDATIKSFIKIVNLTSTLVYAYSMSESATDLPGKVLLEARTVSATSFTAVSAARAAAFLPQLASPATVNNTSTQDSFKNGLMFSKPGQPEAVPLKNLIRVGASDSAIKRIVALRDAVLIHKESDGTWVLTGEDEAHFAVRLLDGTANIVAPDSLAVVNNFAYGLFEAGVCEISPDGGVQILSIPIKDQLLPLYGDVLANLKALAFGFGSDVDGKYILSVPQTTLDTYTTRQHVFDTFGRTWVKWDIALTCGGVNPVDDKIYLGAGDSNYVKSQFRNFNYTDFADFKATCTISSYSGTTLSINNTAGMSIGDLLYQGTSAQAYIESIDSVSGTVTIDAAQTWTTGTADVTHLAAIDCQIQWNPDAAGNAAGLKMYSECAVLQKQAFQKSANLVFSSDINPSEAVIPITSASGNGAWGQFAFGDEVFGGEQAKAPKRVGIPRGHARCNQLSVRFENRVAYSDFQVEGLSLTFTPTSTRTTR